MRQSRGTVVFAGMLGVTLFGLLFTPTFYVLVRYIAAWLGRLGRGSAQPKQILLALPAPAKNGESGFAIRAVGMFSEGELERIFVP
jgi:hypothetical protein